jgi:hypothetical protein
MDKKAVVAKHPRIKTGFVVDIFFGKEIVESLSFARKNSKEDNLKDLFKWLQNIKSFGEINVYVPNGSNLS